MYPNCDITHYTINISGGSQGTVKLPPNTEEYVFEKLINLNGKSLFGDIAEVPSENITIRTFQFKISADSTKENLTGIPSFYEATLNKIESSQYDRTLENQIRRLNFRFVPEILTYDDNEKTIKVIDLDAEKVLLRMDINQSSGIVGANVKNFSLK